MDLKPRKLDGKIVELKDVLPGQLALPGARVEDVPLKPKAKKKRKKR